MLGSEVHFRVENLIEDTALHTAVENHITNQLIERQQQQQLPTWQAVDGRRELQHWLRAPPSLTPGPLCTPPSASSAEREGSPKPADDGQTLCTTAPPSTLSPSEIDRRGQQIILQILQTPVSQEEADFLRSLPVYTPPRSSSGDQDFTLFPPALAEGEAEGEAGREEEEPPAKEARSTNSPLFNTATNSWPLPPIESVTRLFWDPIRDAFREQVQVEKMEDTENWLRGLPNVDEMLEPES
ncbi:hypothetical protein A7C99_1352 [Trichophyton rubrum]|uniref:Uncharacterized protein n=1 Tax=Trichophyton rubrum TaxID=5551 RepID=A0A178F5P6_TRIRU|nr:hypothetical protein A7C99_1352 [Trichophyton rubrum]